MPISSRTAVALLLLLLAVGLHAAPADPPGGEGAERYLSAEEPWRGSQERFVRDMLLKWRDDYAGLSLGEIRVKAHEVLLGLEPPSERYAIETMKKGGILFERVDGGLRCTITRPKPPVPAPR
ncbi:MAG: hypothetical protein PHN82_02115 [bacterium]|nr:hypothetical protein [bacterium]